MNRTAIARYPRWIALTLFCMLSSFALAQTTTFTYQGKLTSAGIPANGDFDLQFKLYDTPIVATGVQQGATLTRNPTTAIAGVFTVTLDFGANVFDGAARYLEIGVRPTGSADPYAVLSPRQPITSTPYAIQTLNAQQLGGVPASSYTKLDSNGNLGIGTETPSHRLTISGGPGWTFDNWGGAQALDNAAAIGWKANASGYRFGLGRTNAGLTMFRTTSELGTATSPPTYDLRIDNAGNVGVGNVNLNTNLTFAKLNVLGGGSDGLYSESGSGKGVVGSSDSNYGVYGTSNNSDGVRGLSLNATGVYGQSSTHSGLFGFSSASQTLNYAGVYGLSDGDGGIGVIGQANTNNAVGVFGVTTSPAGVGVFGRNLSGRAMVAEGNVGQSRDKGGWVKAMAFVNGDGTILRCFNSFFNGAAASTPPCGFVLTYIGEGTYDINFGFQISDRFFSITPTAGGEYNAAGFDVLPNGQLRVTTFGITVGIRDTPFMVIVY